MSYRPCGPQGEVEGLGFSGAKAVSISALDGVWTGGSFTAAPVLRENPSDELRAAPADVEHQN